MKVISIDIETTGLDSTQDDILEVGAVYDDLTENMPDVPCAFRCVSIPSDGRFTVNSYCAELHQGLWPEIREAESVFPDSEIILCRSNKGEMSPVWDKDQNEGYDLIHCEGTVLWHEDRQTYYCRPEMIGWCFFQWLNQYGVQQGDMINIAGKNVGMFDIPFLSEPPYLFRETARVGIRHRTVDPSILFFRLGEDDKLPDLSTCLERAGMSPTALHTSVGDALDVLRLLRYAMSRKETT